MHGGSSGYRRARSQQMPARDHHTSPRSMVPRHRQSDSSLGARATHRRYRAALSNLFTLFEPIAVALRLTKWRTTITVFTAVMPGQGRGARQEAGRGIK